MNKVINVCLSVSFTFHVIASEWKLLNVYKTSFDTKSCKKTGTTTMIWTFWMMPVKMVKGWCVWNLPQDYPRFM